MKTKFNKFERVAGLFVLTAIFGVIATTIGVGVKRGWFETRIPFEMTLDNADGIREGTPIQMAGLHAGSVSDVELKNDGQIRVKFEVAERFQERIRKDSIARVMRPFLIGEKVIDISLGSEAEPVVSKFGLVKSEPSMDLMEMLSGRTLGPQLATLSKMSENLKFVAESFTDPSRTRALVSLFDEMSPLVKNMNSMSKEATSLIRDVNKNKQLVHAVDNLVTMTDEVNRMIPQLSKESPDLARDLAHIAKNTALLTDELQKTLPIFEKMAPEIPHASARALEALDETVVTLKALEKSFLLRGNVRDVREEEAARSRMPASINEPASGSNQKNSETNKNENSLNHSNTKGEK